MRASLRIAGVVLGFLLAAGPRAAAEDAPNLHEGRDAASWAADLASADLDARRKAAFALWQVGTDARPHARALAKALRDEDAYVRGTVEKSLARFDWMRSMNTLVTALPELIDALGDERAAVRLAAANLIWSAGPVPNVVGGDPPPETLVPALVKALGDEDAGVRANAAAALANLQKGALAALPALEQSLADEDPKVRMWATRALSWIDAAKTMPKLLALAKDADAGVRTTVCEAASSAPPEHAEAALAVLQQALQDPDKAVRTAAANACWSLARPEAVPDLARALKHDTDPGVRAAAANALGGIGDPAAVPHLLAALDGKDETVLAGAIGGLSRLGPEGAAGLPRLIELLTTGSATLQRSVALSLGAMGPWAEPALPALVAALKHEDATVRSMAASSLSGIVTYGVQSADLRAAVIAGLADTEPQVRQYCTGMVGSLGPHMPAAAPALLDLLARRDEPLFTGGIYYALQKIGPAAKQALPVLRKAAAEPGEDRAAAAAALACVSEDAKEIDGAVQVLIDAMSEEAQRYAAIYRLKLVGPRAQRAALILRIWTRTESPIRLEAAGALLRIEGVQAADAAAVLAEALAGDQAGPAMRAVRDLGPEGSALIPALLVHARDPASSWRTGALQALRAMEAHGEAVRAAYVAARTDKDAWVRTFGALGLAALEKTDKPR